MSKEYYLQDSRSCVGTNMAWWAKGGKGYTCDLDKAEIYSEDKAVNLHNNRETDLPWPVEYIDERCRETVDCQHLNKDEAKNETGDESYVFQTQNKWDGNDVYFKTKNGKDSTEIAKALVVPIYEVLEHTIGEDSILWPHSYIYHKKRRTISINKVNLSKAHIETGLEIRKPRKPVQTYHCICGKFVSIRDYYADVCGAGVCIHE